MLARSDTGAGQPVALIKTRMCQNKAQTGFEGSQGERDAGLFLPGSESAGRAIHGDPQQVSSVSGVLSKIFIARFKRGRKEMAPVGAGSLIVW